MCVWGGKQRERGESGELGGGLGRRPLGEKWGHGDTGKLRTRQGEYTGWLAVSWRRRDGSGK